MVKVSRNAPERRSGGPKNLKSVLGPQNVRIFTGTLDKEQQLCNAVKVVDPTSFPHEISPEFGETEVRSLCDRFGFNFNTLKHDYREFKESRGDVTSPGIKLLKNCVSTLPVGTSECERGFTIMNVICT